MVAIICCILDSRGDQHRGLVDSVAEKCMASELFIYRENQDLPTVERYNLAYASIKHPKFTHYMFAASDIEIKTADFDRLLMKITDLASFRKKHRSFVLYPDDGIHGENLCTHPIFTQEFLEATGEFFPSGYMRHCYVDNYTMHIASKTDTLLFCPTAEIIHFHPTSSVANKAAMDEHYEHVYKSEFQAEDHRRYELSLIEKAPSVIDRIERSKKSVLVPFYTVFDLKNRNRKRLRMRQLKKVFPFLR